MEVRLHPNKEHELLARTNVIHADMSCGGTISSQQTDFVAVQQTFTGPQKNINQFGIFNYVSNVEKKENGNCNGKGTTQSSYKTVSFICGAATVITVGFVAWNVAVYAPEDTLARGTYWLTSSDGMKYLELLLNFLSRVV